MPRILSRNTAIYKRRPAPSFSRQNSATSSNASLPRYSRNGMPWYGAAGFEQDTSSETSSSSASTTARSSPSMSRQRSAVSAAPSRRDSSQLDNMMMFPNEFESSSMQELEDGWGQFVDTAEAEEEVIRSSKILSKRYSLRC